MSHKYAHLETERRFLVRAIPAGVALAVDEFEDGTLVAELDGGEARPADPPAWLEVIREVTGDEAFTGAGRAAGTAS